MLSAKEILRNTARRENEKLFPRHCEEQSDEAIHSFFPWRDGLLCFARNDGSGPLKIRIHTDAWLRHGR
jgi:hypothetical protein